MLLLLLISLPVMSEILTTPWNAAYQPPCPSPSPEVCPSSCPLHQWYLPAVLSSDTLFSFCPQSFPAPGTFPMSELFASGDQNTAASTSASALPMSLRGWFPLRLTGWISLLSKGLSGVFSSTKFKDINSLAFCLLYGPVLTTVCETNGKTIDLTIPIDLTIGIFVNWVISLLFNTLSRFVMAFLKSSNRFLISWLRHHLQWL